MTGPTLLLILDGPMQAWGYLSYYDRRNILHYPTRSALVGMFCAAAGIDRNDVQGLRRWAPLRLEVHSYPKLVNPQVIAYRRWSDYHTVGGGYDRENQRRHIPVSAEKKSRGSVVTHREYLSDALFVVFVTCPGHKPGRDLLEELCGHLCSPKWGIWLGRKCCIPSFPVCHKVHESKEAAMKHLQSIRQYRPMDLGRPLRVVTEVEEFDDGTDTLLDVPLDFAARRFDARRIKEDISAGEMSNSSHESGTDHYGASTGG
jgi:CRISPR system Cascade subunit CasD